MRGMIESRESLSFSVKSSTSSCFSVSIQGHQQGFPFHPEKSSPNSKTRSSIAYVSQPQFPEPMFSRSTFCTSLFLSSSTSSDTHQPLSNLPFLPPPPKYDQSISAVNSSNSPLLLSGDIGDRRDEGDCSGDLLKNFHNFPENSSDDSFHAENFATNCLAFNEQLELQILSEELHIAMTDNGENPGMDEIYEVPLVSSVPEVETKSIQTHQCSVPPVGIQLFSTSSTSKAAAVHKPRLRWTLELHESFIEAVNKLDGAEKATPKAILKAMNVEGLTIYHIKSHLQKYRLAKYLPEMKEDKKGSSEEKKVTTVSKEGDAGTKKGMHVTEALRMQMEVQKQLHEQLEVQRALQLRIEEHARYLQKILEEQQKAGNSFMPSYSRQSLPDMPSSSEPQVESSPKSQGETDSNSTSLPSKHKSTDSESESEPPVNQKRLRVDVMPETASEYPCC
ncbi:myb-like HTH transcriptional regulator family protein isoform X2 [Tasmannia lanceolata]|uniref:myb-like HTH transcriptional regulator family protein isoform X2 n=1 Tax=Tasmannia lanceolata TaxID=3420 RepID=UPI004063BE40